MKETYFANRPATYELRPDGCPAASVVEECQKLEGFYWEKGCGVATILPEEGRWRVLLNTVM